MNTQTYSRRSVLRAGAGAAIGGVALANARPARAQTTFDGWMDGVSNYDGVVDQTGNGEVTVEVGAEGNGGNFGFGPAAVQVDPGTTVTWEWVNGSHNVQAEDGSFESELTNEKGFTFSQTFEDTGVVKYFCMPHKSMGMKGVVVVGDAAAGASAAGGQSGGGGGGANGELTSADWGAVAFGVSLVAGLLSPLAFAAFLGGDDGPQVGERVRPE